MTTPAEPLEQELVSNSRHYRYYDLVMAGFVTVLLCSNLIEPGKAMFEVAAADLGLRPAAGYRHAGLPWGLIRAVGIVHPPWRELARMSYLWHVPHALEGGALERAVGHLPATPLATALGHALRDLGFGTPSACLHAATR